jgi:hypothetical protein
MDPMGYDPNFFHSRENPTGDSSDYFFFFVTLSIPLATAERSPWPGEAAPKNHGYARLKIMVIYKII